MKQFDPKAINAAINKYLSPQGMSDLNKFIEQMPMRAGYGVLVAGGVVWLIAGLAVVYATTVAKDVSAIRAELVKSEALKPVVAQLVRTPVPDSEISAFVDKVDPLYNDVSIKNNGSGTIQVTSGSGRFFGAFREAINHAYNGGQRWRLSLQSLCVGRECKGGFLNGTFNVDTLKVQR
jgi:hypothetical protein